MKSLANWRRMSRATFGASAWPVTCTTLVGNAGGAVLANPPFVLTPGESVSSAMAALPNSLLCRLATCSPFRLRCLSKPLLSVWTQ